MDFLKDDSVTGRGRVQMESVSPQIDDGRFAAKRVVGDAIDVRARIFADGHDVLSGRLLYRHESERQWSAVVLSPLANDWWRAVFTAERLGQYFFTIEAWIDRFATWQRDLRKRIDARQEIEVELLIGARIIRDHLPLVPEDERRLLESIAGALEGESDRNARIDAALSPMLFDLM
jgi:starch synthase (maltosyl-transferring)